MPETPAKFWKRLLAYIIDIAIINFIIILPFKPTLDKLAPNNQDIFSLYTFFLTNLQQIKIIFIITFFIALFSILYWTILEFKLSQSIGKLALNIFVKSENKNLTFSQCLLRNITKISTFLLFLDTLFIFSSIKKQRLFDKLAKTIVIEK